MKRQTSSLVLMTILVGSPFAVGSADAAPVFTSNFDSIAVPEGTFIIIPSLEGWTGGDNGIEVQNNVAGIPQTVPNHVELDTTANSSMFRTISDPGLYQLTWSYSARPGRPATTNVIQVLLDGTPIDGRAKDGDTQTDWGKPIETIFTVGNTPSVLSFQAVGTSDGFGGYVDTVSLSLVPAPAGRALLGTALAALGLIGSRARP